MNRKKLITILGILLLSMSCKGPQKADEPCFTYTNPILHLDYSDPDVCRVGEDYYMTASSFNCFPGLPILHSRDLVHWEQVGAALKDYPDDAFRHSVQHGNGVWAPAIRYHDGWFYIYVGDPDRGIFMVRAQDPAGEWEKPVWVVREKGFIDPCPLWDDDGKAYLSHALAGSRAGLKSVVLVAPLSADGTRLEGQSKIVFDGHLTQPTIEGTKFYKRGTYYYIFAPAGGVATGWQTVLRSKSPWGPFEEKVVMAWAPGTINGPHQGAWVHAVDGSDWFIHFQDKGAYGRIVHLQPMNWTDNDWPVIGEDPDGDGVGQPIMGYTRPSGPRYDKGCHTERSERISEIGLDFSWQFPAVPEATWQMVLPEGGIRLYSVEQEPGTLWNCRNVIQQKFPAERFTVQARLSFRPNPQLTGETAGFVVMGSDYAGLFLVGAPEGTALQYRKCHEAGKGGQEEIIGLETIPYSCEKQVFPYASANVPAVNYPDRPEAELWVKLEVRPKSVEGNVPDAVCRFYWSRDGNRWNKMPESFTARPELWIGAKFGFFCNRYAHKNDAGWLDVTELRIKPEYAPLDPRGSQSHRGLCTLKAPDTPL